MANNSYPSVTRDRRIGITRFAYWMAGSPRPELDMSGWTFGVDGSASRLWPFAEGTASLRASPQFFTGEMGRGVDVEIRPAQVLGRDAGASATFTETIAAAAYLFTILDEHVCDVGDQYFGDCAFTGVDLLRVFTGIAQPSAYVQALEVLGAHNGVWREVAPEGDMSFTGSGQLQVRLGRNVGFCTLGEPEAPNWVTAPRANELRFTATLDRGALGRCAEFVDELEETVLWETAQYWFHTASLGALVVHVDRVEDHALAAGLSASDADELASSLFNRSFGEDHSFDPDLAARVRDAGLVLAATRNVPEGFARRLDFDYGRECILDDPAIKAA